MMNNPWETEGDYAEGIAYGLPMFIRRHDSLKTLCGYCGVPEGHRYFGKDYNELLDIDVHGGLTFSTGGVHQHFGYFWWFGFDCAHAYDLIPGFINSPFGTNEFDLYRSMKFAQKECVRLAEQLSDGKIALPDRSFEIIKEIPERLLEDRSD